MVQMEMALISHQVERELVEQRAVDGYISATSMCKVAGRLLGDYLRLASTRAYLDELSTDMGIPITELVQVVRGGTSSQQGTWIHPEVAVHLGQWLSPKFAVMVARWVREWMSGTKPSMAVVPYHIERYLANRAAIPHTHFSMLTEMTFALIAPLEDLGYRLPERLMPDISEGQMFSRWLRDSKNVDTAAMPAYQHVFADGRIVNARLYPIEHLADFRRHFNETWLPNRCIEYFQGKDAAAVPYVQQMLALPAPSAETPAGDVPPKKLARFWKR